MRTIAWNLRRATQGSQAWKLFLKYNPDLALLQEVGSIPRELHEEYDIVSKKAAARKSGTQTFSTAVFVRGEILGELSLTSPYDWVNRELERLQGNFISCTVNLGNKGTFNVVSVHSPAWPIDENRLGGEDVSSVKLRACRKLN